MKSEQLHKSAQYSAYVTEARTRSEGNSLHNLHQFDVKSRPANGICREQYYLGLSVSPFWLVTGFPNDMTTIAFIDSPGQSISGPQASCMYLRRFATISCFVLCGVVIPLAIASVCNHTQFQFRTSPETNSLSKYQAMCCDICHIAKCTSKCFKPHRIVHNKTIIQLQ